MYKFSKNQRDIFLSGNMGLEREALRVDQHGLLAMTPFPEKLGDKVNNPHYTVDFSESQLEIITSVKHSPRELYNSLLNKTHYANQVLGQESLWPFSMPGKLPQEKDIPMASFPDPQFKSKEMYRRGLVRRYGSYMQMISGIHYNFSFTAEQIKVLLSITGYSHSDQLYLALSRNFLRLRWLFILLFGASPVAHKQYIDSQSHRIAYLMEGCECYRNLDFLKTAVSLRMSPLGYQGIYPCTESISYNRLEDYIQLIKYGMNHPAPQWESEPWEENQLNANYMQTEGELYVPIRLKGVPQKPLVESLETRGIEYIEIRSIDVNPFDPTGITLDQLYFIQLFLLYCVLEDSPMMTSKEMLLLAERDHLVSLWGRMEDFHLQEEPLSRETFKELGERIFIDLYKLAGQLSNDSGFLGAVELGWNKLRDPQLWTSSQIMKLFKQQGNPFEDKEYLINNRQMGELNYA